MFALVATSGYRTVRLVESSSSSTERVLAASIDSLPPVELQIDVYHAPGLALGQEHLLVWAGRRLYALPVKGGSARLLDAGDVTIAAYEIGVYWFVVGETGVRVVDAVSRNCVTEWPHNEVVLESSWSDGRLIIKDLQARRYELRFDKELRKLSETPSG